jgi:hypothetical protein
VEVVIMRLRQRAPWPAIVAAGLLLAACGDGVSPAPSVDSFSIDVIPAEEPTAVRTTVPGQQEIFLVTADPREGTGPITITATAELARILEIEPALLTPGEVVEVTVVPDEVGHDVTGSVTITGARDGRLSVVERSLPIWAEDDGRAEDAARIRDLFVPWIVAEHPELGIDGTTEWIGTIVQPQILVVSHYLYLTDEWEMGIEWHVMMPPDDWARMYLRHRYDESAPTIAAVISTVLDGAAPEAADPPEAVFR